MRSPSLFCIGKIVMCISFAGLILPLHLNYIWGFIDMFLHIITVSVLLYLCMLYNIIVGYTSSWVFLYFSCARVITPLHHCYICICIHILVNIIYMVTTIFLFTSYYSLLGCITYWKSCHANFLYNICFSIFIIHTDLHSQNWINIWLFELVVTCIETHIVVPNCSISHLFISIIHFSVVSNYS